MGKRKERKKGRRTRLLMRKGVRMRRRWKIRKRSKETFLAEKEALQKPMTLSPRKESLALIVIWKKAMMVKEGTQTILENHPQQERRRKKKSQRHKGAFMRQPRRVSMTT